MEMKITREKSSVLCVIGSFFLTLSFCFPFGNAALAANEQTVANFLVDKEYDYLGRTQADALPVYESDDAYFYFEKEYYASLTPQQQNTAKSLIEKLGGEFDSVIYPETKNIFGDEWNPGIDGSKKITILFVRMSSGVGGYFNANDEYKKDQVVDDNSNEREMIYLNTNYLTQQKEEGFLSHELQHMIYWNEKTQERGLTDDIWISEGRSELASSIIENALRKKFSEGATAIRKKDFLLGHTDSLTDWNNLNYDYASVNVFMQYLKDRVGTGIFREMNDTLKTGVANLDSVLKSEKNLGLNDIFTDWTIANYINDTDFDPRYGYSNENFKTDFNVSADSIYDKDGNDVINVTGTLKNWSADYFKVDLSTEKYANRYLDMEFNGEDTAVFSLPVVINYKDGSKKVDFINMDGKQNGHLEMISAENGISSIVFIPSSQKIDEAMNGNQVQSHSYSLDIKLTPIEDKKLPNGMLIRAADDEKIYLIEDGRKRWITDSATFAARGYRWASVKTVSETELGIYENGERVSGGGVSVQEGDLVKGVGPEVYLIENGQRRWVSDAATFSSLGFSWEKIIQISDQELFKYAEGETLKRSIFADGTLVKSSSGPQVYFLRNAQKCWITSPEAFSKNNFNWSSVVATSEEILSSYADGPSID